MSDNPAEILRGVPFLAGVGDDVLARLAERMRARTFRRNEVIFHQGDPAGATHIIRKGRVKVTRQSEEGDETVLALLGPGAIFGEMGPLDGQPRSATLTAIEPTETLMLLREDLLASAREFPDLAMALIEGLSSRLRQTDEKLEDAYYHDLDTRLARCLCQLAEDHGRQTADGIEVDLPLTQSDFAGMLGVTRVSINRQFGIYQDEGLLRLNRRSFTILRPEALRRRARL
jgi:CRP/FNR family transcriptional regulator, cyclic AMP receptor protein